MPAFLFSGSVVAEGDGDSLTVVPQDKLALVLRRSLAPRLRAAHRITRRRGCTDRDGFLLSAQPIADLPGRLINVGLDSQPVPMHVNGLEDLVLQASIGGKRCKVISDPHALFVHLVGGVEVLDVPIQRVLWTLNEVPPVPHDGLRGFVLGSLITQ